MRNSIFQRYRQWWNHSFAIGQFWQFVSWNWILLPDKKLTVFMSFLTSVGPRPACVPSPKTGYVFSHFQSGYRIVNYIDLFKELFFSFSSINLLPFYYTGFLVFFFKVPFIFNTIMSFSLLPILSPNSPIYPSLFPFKFMASFFLNGSYMHICTYKYTYIKSARFV